VAWISSLPLVQQHSTDLFPTFTMKASALLQTAATTGAALGHLASINSTALNSTPGLAPYANTTFVSPTELTNDPSSYTKSKFTSTAELSTPFLSSALMTVKPAINETSATTTSASSPTATKPTSDPGFTCGSKDYNCVAADYDYHWCSDDNKQCLKMELMRAHPKGTSPPQDVGDDPGWACRKGDNDDDVDLSCLVSDYHFHVCPEKDFN
jgi:hypothetical protein